MSETLTPTGGLPRVGVWFEILSLGFAGVIVVSELLMVTWRRWAVAILL